MFGLVGFLFGRGLKFLCVFCGLFYLVSNVCGFFFGVFRWVMSIWVIIDLGGGRERGFIWIFVEYWGCSLDLGLGTGTGGRLVFDLRLEVFGGGGFYFRRS